MSTGYIRYRSGYKHQLAEDYQIAISIRPAHDIDAEFISLDRNGKLTVRSGYAWDGTSGPVPDTAENLRASLVHDALYQLMRMRKLSASKYKDTADRIFHRLCIKDGVSSFYAAAYYQALRIGGKPATDPNNAKPVYRAPAQ